MPLPNAHPPRLADKEIRRLLDATDDALVRSNARMHEAFVALSRARQDNALQRQWLTEFHRVFPPPSRS